MQRFLDALIEFWHFPVYSSGGNLIRLHQLVLAAIILLVGIAAARRIGRMAMRAIRSKIRITESTSQILERALFYILIDQAFRDAGVVIAFPQRDVHIDFAGPVPVQLDR